MKRTPTEIIQSHLNKRLNGDLENDIKENFSENIIILSAYGIFKGHEGIRASSAELNRLLGDSIFKYRRVLIEDNYALLEWQAKSADREIKDGVDSFVIENEKIVFQAIHYTVQKRKEE